MVNEDVLYHDLAILKMSWNPDKYAKMSESELLAAYKQIHAKFQQTHTGEPEQPEKRKQISFDFAPSAD